MFYIWLSVIYFILRYQAHYHFYYHIFYYHIFYYFFLLRYYFFTTILFFIIIFLLLFLQDFSTRREEAVILMISADVYGKKTMLSTSGVGLSKITEKLNDMQREWNSFQASLAETKARLEASLMKWSDVDSGISQLRCWMKEVTRRLLEVDHLSTLNEKKAQLQRTKVIHSDYKKIVLNWFK